MGSAAFASLASIFRVAKRATNASPSGQPSPLRYQMLAAVESG
jgi:hypothetical protein